VSAAPPVLVLTGQLAAGKSTLARLALARWERGLHLDVDAVREQVVQGLAGPLPWTDETTRQFALAVRACAAQAAVYHRAGYAVAVEGAIDPADVDAALAEVGLLEHRVGVVLHPRLEAARERNRTRTHKPFGPDLLHDVIGVLDADLASAPVPPGWTVLDTSDDTVEQSLQRVLALVGRTVAAS
jgi:adenylylsulfate kinase-like enzyme